MAELIDAGPKCPSCGEARDVEGGAFDGDGGQAWQRVTCNRCGCVFDEVYRYVGTEVVEEGEPQPGRSA